MKPYFIAFVCLREDVIDLVFATSAKAGVQLNGAKLDSRLRGNDKQIINQRLLGIL